MAFDEDAVIAVDVIVEEVIVGAFDAEGSPGARGPQGENGWTPELATVADGARRVLQLVNWTGGTGTQPGHIGEYVGVDGFVVGIADAIDIRGAQGAQGPQGQQGLPGAVLVGDGANIFTEDRDPVQSDGTVGDLWINNITGEVFSKKAGPNTPLDDFWDPQSNIIGPQGPQGLPGDDGAPGAPGVAGAQGLNGWSPLYTTVLDGQRIVLQTVDWVGGSGTKPAVGAYMGAGVLTNDITLAVNIRGAAGAGTPGVDGANGLNFYRGIGVPANSFGRDNETYLNLSTYDVYSKSAGVWTLAGNIKGADGAPGAPGGTGPQGTSFRWSTVDPVAGDGNNGDTWLNTTSYHLFTKAAGAWTDRGSIKGAQGDQGPQGVPGTPGTDGADSTVPGPQGDPGATGPAGAAFLSGSGNPSVGIGVNGDSYVDVLNGNVFKKTGGAWGSSIGSLRGPQGTAGTPGATGAAGTRGTLWYFGSGEPTTVPGALALDKYVDTVDGDVFEFTGSVWVDAAFNIKGVQGDPGPQGNPGTAGGTGPAGASFRSGAGVPSNALGAQGDSYLNTTNGDVYGPKGVSSWGSATGNIRGSNGTPGTNGTNGSQFLSGAGIPNDGIGVQNDFYLNTSNGDMYKKGATTWGSAIFNATGPQGAPGTPGINAADLMYFFPGKATASQVLVRSIIKRAFSMALTTSAASAGAAATASTAWTVKKNGTTVATLTWSAAGTVAVITGTSPVGWAVDDVLTIVGPGTADATLADVNITLFGSR